MQWNAKIKAAKVQPKLGDRRNRKRFALFPVRTFENKWIWLQFYTAVQQWSIVTKRGEAIKETRKAMGDYNDHSAYPMGERTTLQPTRIFTLLMEPFIISITKPVSVFRQNHYLGTFPNVTVAHQTLFPGRDMKRLNLFAMPDNYIAENVTREQFKEITLAESYE